MIRRLAILALAVVCLIPGVARATSLSSSVIGLFPKNVGEFAYADLRSARQLKWFPQLKDQLLPPRFREFEKFLASAGVDPDSQVDELAWAFVAPDAPKDGTASNWVPTGDQIVGVALGQFNPASAEMFFKSQKLTTAKAAGFTLYPFGSGSGPQDLFFLFIDTNTAAFGQREILEKLLAVRSGEEDSLFRSDTMYPLVREVNGSGLVWVVLDAGFARLAIQQLLPATPQDAQSTKLTAKLKAMIINVQGSSSLDARFQTVCATPEDANTFAALLQAGLLYRQYQEGSTNPELAKMLQETRVAPIGDRLDVRMSLTEEQMVALIKRNAFALRM